MVVKILLAITVLLGGFFAYVAMQPAEMAISRELLIEAPPQAIFPYINSAKKADEWMPWKDADPDVQMQYSGPEEGVGAISSWDSKGQMGTGQAEIVESVPDQRVKTRLTYTSPMNMSQVAEISLTPSVAGTTVRWSVTGKNTFLGRLMCVFVDMEKMVGGEFEKGLKKLKQLIEEGG